MKKSRLIVACTLGLLVAPSAFAVFVEGRDSLEALRTKPSMAQGGIQRAVPGGAEESIYGLLATQQEELASRKGVAGRSGAEMGMWTSSPSRHGEGSIYDEFNGGSR
jgi:hypothetical protein